MAGPTLGNRATTLLPTRIAPVSLNAMTDAPNVIRFPGSGGVKSAPAQAAVKAPAPAADATVGPDGLTEDQRKAIQVILSGMTFVLIGIKPTDRGADFFTSLHGDATDLRNSQQHLDGVIARALSKRGI